jgi:hypothetical protein
VRLADSILRRGHLSERALIDILMTGARPVHLDRCSPCAERAVELGRWLDEIRTIELEEADAAFPAERLALQQRQILRRLEQAERPARVIAFPGLRDERFGPGGHGIRPAWIAIAAAAGLVLGLVGGQVTARLAPERAAAPPAAAPAAVPADGQAPATPVNVPAASTATASNYIPLDIDEYDRPQIAEVAAMDAYTPRVLPASELVLRPVRRGR